MLQKEDYCYLLIYIHWLLFINPHDTYKISFNVINLHYAIETNNLPTLSLLLYSILQASGPLCAIFPKVDAQRE